jgi:putative hydroxymethylpyrimidine transport system substrate-binding protein
LISKKVDAVIGAFRNFELNQMNIVGQPGNAFYPEETGVPHYEELIYIINKNNKGKTIYKDFLDAVQKATVFIINNPKKSWELFHKYKKGLNDELNKRAFKDTISRFSARPGAIDKSSYKKFQKFLFKKGIISKLHDIDLFLNSD